MINLMLPKQVGEEKHVCKIHRKPALLRSEENYFFRLSRCVCAQAGARPAAPLRVETAHLSLLVLRAASRFWREVDMAEGGGGCVL